MDSVWFIFFSTLDALSIFTIMFTIYRFNVLEYKNQLLPISVLMAITSYAIWRELDLGSYAPMISIVIFTIFVFVTLRTSLFGALIVSITGYAAAVVVQTAALLILTGTAAISLEKARSNEPDMYLLLAVSSIAIFLISFLLYRKRYGLTTNLDRFRWKGEDSFVLGILILGTALVAILPIFATRLYLAEVIYFLIFAFLIFLSRRKGRN